MNSYLISWKIFFPFPRIQSKLAWQYKDYRGLVRRIYGTLKSQVQSLEQTNKHLEHKNPHLQNKRSFISSQLYRKLKRPNLESKECIFGLFRILKKKTLQILCIKSINEYGLSTDHRLHMGAMTLKLYSKDKIITGEEMVQRLQWVQIDIDQ